MKMYNLDLFYLKGKLGIRVIQIKKKSTLTVIFFLPSGFCLH